MEKTQKWQILAVLENGASMRVNQIRFMLEKDFSLKPKPAALWKNLQRCSHKVQGLISIEKIGRTNFCRITEKGRKRRKIIAARKEEEFKGWLDTIFRAEKEKRLRVSQQKSTISAQKKRMFEVQSSLKLCDALLSRSSDQNTSNYAFLLRTYWQNEEVTLIPMVAEELAKGLTSFLKNSQIQWKRCLSKQTTELTKADSPLDC